MKDLINICNISGGKDSTAMYLIMMEYFGNDFIPLFDDTGHEHPVTVNYVKNLHKMSGGPEVIILKANFEKQLEKKGLEPTNNPFLDMMQWKGRAPSSKAQFCTEWVKLYPTKLWLSKHYPNGNYLLYSGVRALESRSRANKQPFSIHGYYDCWQIFPMLYETEQTMFDIMEKAGVPPNPLYALGYKRVGCFPCIHSNKTQLSLLPDWAWDRLKYYERIIGRRWFPPNLVPGIHLATIEGKAEPGNIGIDKMPTFGKSFKERRCIIPVSGFIEGPEKEKLSKPFNIVSPGGTIYLAAIQNRYTKATGETENSFAILTQPAIPICAKIGHHRSPVMLYEDLFEFWLDPSTQLPELFDFLKMGYFDSDLEAYPLDANLIKSGKLHEPEVLEPIGEAIR